MRLILGIIALVFGANAFSASINMSTARCPDGFHRPLNGDTTYCPVALFPLTVSAGSTTATVSGITSSSGGTTYGRVILGACSSPPQWRDVVNGVNAIDTDSAAQSTTTVSQSYSGLTGGATYCAQAVNVLPSGHVSLVAQKTFVATATPGTEDLTGTCYVVDSVSGSDSNDGLTVATAFQTLAKAEATVTTGDDVCLMDDSQWNEQLTINKSGISPDYASWQAVYVDTGDSNKLVRYDEGTGTGRGARPWIGGDTNDACIAAQNCTTFNGSGSVNSSDAPQVNITCVDYVEVVGIRVAYTKGRGISPNCDKNITGSVSHILIHKNTLDHIGTISIYVYNGAQDIAVLENYVTRDSICHLQARNTGVQQSQCKVSGGGWGGSVVFNQYVDNVLVEQNTIEDVYGECVGLNRYATNAVGRGNVCRNSHSTAFYCDMATAIFESNIADGAETGVTDDPSSPFGGGFDAGNEKGLAAAKCLFRNNIGFGASSNMAKVAYFPLAEAPSGAGLSAWFYGNTFAGGVSGITGNNGKNHPTPQITAFGFRSNIVYATDITAANIVTFSNTSAGWAGDDFDYNLLYTYSSNSRAIGANDPTAGDPQLALGSSMATFRAQGISSPTTVDDARLGGSSPALGAGDPDLKTTAFVSSVVGITLSEWIKSFMTYPFTPDWTNWDKALYYDFEGTARHATAPNAGALETSS